MVISRLEELRNQQENIGVSLVAQTVQKSTCDVGDLGSIPGLGRFPGGGNAIHSRVLAWEIPWTEEPGRLQSTGSQRVKHD